MGDNDADERMDDREGDGDVMGIHEENADAMLYDEDAIEEEETSDIEMIDAVVIVKHPKESNPESVTDKISDEEM